MPRTQDEVNALWPAGKYIYTFVAHVTTPGVTTITDAAKELQKLYEGHEAMAGEFNVEPEPPNLTGEHPMFLVSFVRDVPDDIEVVNEALLAGGEFDSVLRAQFETEFVASAKEKNLGVKLAFLSLPEFIKG